MRPKADSSTDCRIASKCNNSSNRLARSRVRLSTEAQRINFECTVLNRDKIEDPAESN